MGVLSVPLTAKLKETVNQLVKSGVAPSKAELVRMAIESFAEYQAIEDVLRAEKELKDGKILRGDLDKLIKKFK